MKSEGGSQMLYLVEIVYLKGGDLFGKKLFTC